MAAVEGNPIVRRKDWKKVYRTLYGWLFDCVYVDVFEDFMTNGKIEKVTSHIVKDILDKDIVDMPYRQDQRNIIELMTLLTEAYKYKSPPPGKETVLEKAFVIFKRLISKLSEDAMLSAAKIMELELRVQALYVSCAANDFETASQAFIRLDLEERSTYAAVKSKNREVLNVMNSGKVDNPILILNTYENFIQKIKAFINTFHKTLPDTSYKILQLCEEMQQTKVPISRNGSPVDSQLSQTVISHFEKEPFDDAMSNASAKPRNALVSSSGDSQLWEDCSQFPSTHPELLSSELPELPEPSMEQSFVNSQEHILQQPATLTNGNKLAAIKRLLTVCHGLNKPLPLSEQHIIEERLRQSATTITVKEIRAKVHSHLKNLGILDEVKAHFRSLERKKVTNSKECSDQRSSTKPPQPPVDSPQSRSRQKNLCKTVSTPKKAVNVHEGLLEQMQTSPQCNSGSEGSNQTLTPLSEADSAVLTPACQVLCVPLEADKSVPLPLRLMAANVQNQVPSAGESSSTEFECSIENSPERRVTPKRSKRVINRTTTPLYKSRHKRSASAAAFAETRRSQRVVKKSPISGTPTEPTPPSQLPKIRVPVSRLRLRKSLVNSPHNSPAASSWIIRRTPKRRRVGRGALGIRWTPKEEENLVAGIEKYGTGKWAMIRSDFEFRADRTSQDLSDKWRTLQRNPAYLKEVTTRRREHQRNLVISPEF